MDAPKAILTGDFIMINTNIKKNPQINNLTLHLKQLEKEELGQNQQKEENNRDWNRNKSNSK